ncbi:MAG: 3-oxoadipate enol-lactonase, partial [Gammaproteobacteria bacterium]|nr:3-oxoadipate enol-lactonase [Gammaproteobacteria bacterium]
NRRVAIDHPSRVSALGILNAPHERGEKQQRLVEERARASSAEGPSANIDTTLARWFTPDFRVHSSQQVAALRDIVVANDPKNYAIHRQILAEGVTELIRPTPALKQPSLIMTCQNDSGSTPAMSQAIAQEIMDSELSILPKLQHLGLLEDPNAFAGPLLAFLRSKLPEG